MRPSATGPASPKPTSSRSPAAPPGSAWPPGPAPVTYLGSLLFAADDLVLCLFRGPSRAAVIQASDRLGIPSERLMNSAWLGPNPRRPERTQK
jgi:hypothetical protein